MSLKWQNHNNTWRFWLPFLSWWDWYITYSSNHVISSNRVHCSL